jgi:hypothetical protein
MRKLRDLIIYCDRASNAASELAKQLNCRRIYATASRKLRRTDGSLVINYGTSAAPNWTLGNKSVLLNDPQQVLNSISKVTSYGKFRDASIPCIDFTTEHSVAAGWQSNGDNVLSRRDGLSGGRGISFSKDTGNVTVADFYAKYFPKTHEYRAHVFKGRVIDITQKKLSQPEAGPQPGVADVAGTRTLHQRVVRSLDNGWVHAHENVHLPGNVRQTLEESAVRAVEALGLHFGAVDIVARFSKKSPDKLLSYAVLEVNTAPGLGNQTTIKAYVDAIKELYERTRNDRAIPVRRRVRKMVPVTFVSKKGNRITRMRERWVYE